MKTKKMELKWVIAIAIGTLIVGALIGTQLNFGNYPTITISSNDLKCVNGEGGITECVIINPLTNNTLAAITNPNSNSNITFEAYENGNKINCRFTKVNYPQGDSEYAYVCE